MKLKQNYEQYVDNVRYREGEDMKFEVVYEIPPMRGIFRTVVNADSATDAEEKIRLNIRTKNFRTKEIKLIK